MNPAQQKLVQYLGEAHATEQALTRELQSQIAMTPQGRYRADLETHLEETRKHAGRVGARLKDLGRTTNPVTAVVGLAGDLVEQAVALGKAPWNLVRGSGGDEKVLKNAKDAAASETLEIATYTAIERLARAAGDPQTAELAASIRADEERMLGRIMREIPRLTAAVVGADPADEPAAAPTTNGAASPAKKREPRPARKAPAAPKPDPHEALRTAAEAGDSGAAFVLWERLGDERWLLTAAELGDVRAAHRLGIIWRERDDVRAAVEWLDRAAQADHPAAQRDLGFVLREQGDLHGAHYWLNRAAERDDEARHALAGLG